MLMASPNFANIPQELKRRNQWVLWKTITRAGKPTKVPYRPTGTEADSSDPASWSSYDAVADAYQKGGYDGVGYVFDPLDPYAGIDLDDCVLPDGSLKPKAQMVCDSINSYSEISPSGKGIKIFLKAKNPVNIQKKDGKFQQGFASKKPDLEIEVYYGNRFFTLTGNRLDDCPPTIEDRNSVLTALFKSIFNDRGYFDAPQQVPTARTTTGTGAVSPEGAKRFADLLLADPQFAENFTTPAPVGKRSDAEFSLCARLWEAGIDEADIYLIMNTSPQSKWLERDGNYRQETVRKAVTKAKTNHEPGLKVVTIESGKGAVGYNPKNGTISKVCEFEDVDGNTKTFLGAISDCAVFICTETSAGDITEFVFEGTGASDGRTVKFTMKATDASDKRKFRAALTNAFGAKNQVGKLNFETVQEITLNPRRVRRVEVPVWRDNIPLLPGVDLADDVEFKLSPKIPARVYDGDLPAAKEVLRKLLKVHKYAPILVATILGAPAIARWRKNERFGLGLWGTSGNFKTSTMLASLCLYGTGYSDNPKLKAGKEGSTAVGASEVFASAGFLPQLYDNIKTVDTRDAQTYVSVMHAVLEGDEKARGKKDGGLRDSREFMCTPIITGEIRPPEAATTSRVLNLNWSMADKKILTEVQKNVRLLPVVGYHWLRFLASTDFIFGKDFEEFRDQKMDEFAGVHYTNPGRLATIYSLLVATWNMLEASPLGDVFTDAHDSFKKALDEATAIQGDAVTEETEISRFLSGLEELMASNPGLIASEDGTKTIMGSIIGKRMPDGLFLLPAETLNELGKIKAFNQLPSIDSITQGLNEKGLLIPDPDGQHLKHRIRLNGGNPRGWYLKDGAIPQKRGGVPADWEQQNQHQEVQCSHVPDVPSENERKHFPTENMKNHDRSEDEKEIEQTTGNTGNTGNIDSIDRLIDIDFDSKVGVPSSVPTCSHSDIEVELNTVKKQAEDKERHFAEVADKHIKPKVCAACGEDLTGHGTVERDGKIFCARPGCGYPPRKETVVEEFLRDGGKASLERFLAEFPEARRPQDMVCRSIPACGGRKISLAEIEDLRIETWPDEREAAEAFFAWYRTVKAHPGILTSEEGSADILGASP